MRLPFSIISILTPEIIRQCSCQKSLKSSLRAKLQERRAEADYSLSPNSTALAWLLSFPGSGAEFMLKFLHDYSNTTTAINYGDAKANVPVYWDRPNGPYLIEPALPHHPKFTLALTYCGGRCLFCNPADYMMHRDEFLHHCCRGTKYVSPQNDREPVNYDSRLVDKAVVFLRDPFQVIVDRFLYYAAEGEVNHYNRNDPHRYPKTREGFMQYCSDEFQRFEFVESFAYDAVLFEMAKTAPCHAEMFRYVQWYNLVYQILDFESIPYIVTYYENFDQRRLVDFLEIDHVEKDFAKVMNRTEEERGFFTDEEKHQLSDVLRLLATPYSYGYFKVFGF